MDRFERYIEKTNRAKTPEELFSVFSETLGQYGYDRIHFGLLTDHQDMGLKAGIGILENYPSDWMKYYFENAFDKIDPVVVYATQQDEAFAWEDIGKHIRLHPKQIKCLNLGREAGLHNGVGVPLWGPGQQVAGIGLASSEKKDACRFDADLITAFCNQFYLVYRRLHKKKRPPPENIVLSPREREVLIWAAAGKSDEEIGAILLLSKHTVNMHFRNIYKKIGVNNRILAITKGLSLGLIRR